MLPSRRSQQAVGRAIIPASRLAGTWTCAIEPHPKHNEAGKELLGGCKFGRALLKILKPLISFLEEKAFLAHTTRR